MSNSWWSNKLGTQGATTPNLDVYQAPATPQQQRPVSTPPVQQQVPRGERCPECGSGNYGGATAEARKRCYDCGYPIVQSASGLGKGIVGNGGSPSGSPVPTQQLSTSNNFNPQTIIGKIE